MRKLFTLLIVANTFLPSTKAAAQQPAAIREDSITSRVRRELEEAYRANIRALLAKDLDAVDALRTADYHTVTPDGTVRNRDDMREFTRALFNGIEKWIDTTIDIDSLTLEGDLAIAVVRQHATRRALRPDGLVHHLETWVTQRETWRRTPKGWLLYRVDGLRDQKRLVDGVPG